MAATRSKPFWCFAAVLLWLLWSGEGWAEPPPLDSLKDIFARLHSCWKPPPLSAANPIDITVIVSFNREGVILGHPRITYESEQASDNDRLRYRIAVMETLQRCTPLPFTEDWAVPLPAGLWRSLSEPANVHPNLKRNEHG